MKYLNNTIITLVVITIFSTLINSQKLEAQESFSKHFTKERLRLDVVFAGDAFNQDCFLEGLFKEPLWGGPLNSTTEDFNYGEFNYRVENELGDIIFSKGFNSLFQEWRTTAEAKKIKRSFRSSHTIPFPKSKVNVIFSARNREDGLFYDISTFIIDPNDKQICNVSDSGYKTDTLLYNGNPNNKVDLLFIAEGYTEQEMDKFKEDALLFTGYLFDIEPYKSRKEDFNIWAVQAISKDSGTDIPHQNSWKNTALSSSFYTFNIDRYLTTPDQSIVARAASNVPYDALYIIVNTDKYGGGGIYNFYGLSMASHKTTAEVFVHELGHSFAGLADEYYSSEVAYEEFYNLSLEPWEPNITTMVNFERKWKQMVNSKKAGIFEGGGYTAKGIYRSALNCRMKSNEAAEFCPVCKAAINKMIDHYTQ